MSAFIDDRKAAGFAVELTCRTLGVSGSAYYARRSGERSARAVEDDRLLERIREVHKANYEAYGYRRMWKAMRRAGEDVGRDHVKRLMRDNDIQGASGAASRGARQHPIPRPAGRLTSSIATSARRGRMRCPTSRCR